MTNATRMRTVGMSNAVLISLGEPADDEMMGKIEEIIGSARYIDAEASDWLGEQPTRFVVVFRHSSTMGVARAYLIEALSDRGIRAKIDPL